MVKSSPLQVMPSSPSPELNTGRGIGGPLQEMALELSSKGGRGRQPSLLTLLLSGPRLSSFQSAKHMAIFSPRSVTFRTSPSSCFIHISSKAQTFQFRPGMTSGMVPRCSLSFHDTLKASSVTRTQRFARGGKQQRILPC